jgi:hypothetical protein
MLLSTNTSYCPKTLLEAVLDTFNDRLVGWYENAKDYGVEGTARAKIELIDEQLPCGSEVYTITVLVKEDGKKQAHRFNFILDYLVHTHPSWLFDVWMEGGNFSIEELV